MERCLRSDTRVVDEGAALQLTRGHRLGARTLGRHGGVARLDGSWRCLRATSILENDHRLRCLSDESIAGRKQPGAEPDDEPETDPARGADAKAAILDTPRPARRRH